MSTYYLHDGRNELGPYTIDVLKKQKLTRNTPVREEGTDKWNPAEKVAGLTSLVAPRKIKRPKDIVPVMVERAADFKQQRPKTAYGILCVVALLAGVSMYSLGKSQSHSEAKKMVPSPTISSSATPVAKEEMVLVIKKDTVAAAPKEDKEKKDRLRWSKLFNATNSNYGIGFLGGIKDLKVIVTNKSDYPLDQAVAEVTYIKAGGGVWKKVPITVYGIPAHDSKEQAVTDVGRSKKVTVSIQKLVCKKMKFTYTAGKKGPDPQDPYLM